MKFTGNSNTLQAARPFSVRALNAAGALLQKTGAWDVPLDPQALIDLASRRTGLTDFGDERFREPLQRLLDACEREAQLTFVGRLTVRHDVLRLLTNRLRLQRDRKQNPAIANQKIRRPVFIVGLPRTGTTLLHGLLAQDPDNRTPLSWEVMYPSLPAHKKAATDPRIDRAGRHIAWMRRMAPDIKAIHPIGARLPQECIAIMSHAFMSDQFEVMFDIPGYQSWLERQNMNPAYAWHRSVLQQLQWQQPTRRWLLKAPAHMLSLDALFRAYPDARIIHTHREPLDVLASLASLCTVLRSAFSDHVEPAAVGAEITQRWSRALKAMACARREYSAERFFDLDFTDLLSEPLATVGRLYAYFGWPLEPATKRRMQRFLTRNPRDKHGRHRYSLAQFDLDPEQLAPRFGAYRERFGITGTPTDYAPSTVA